MTRFVVVPQWQGSSSSRALQYVDGAAAIAAELPSSATTHVDVPFEAGESLGSGILRWASLRQAGLRLTDALRGLPERVVTVGGDRSVAVPSILAAGDVAVLWLSAHAGLDDARPASYDRVAVRAILDDAVPAVAERTRIDPSRVLVAGARATEHSDTGGVAVHARVDPEAIGDWASGLTPSTGLFVHVDVGVLDPSAIASIQEPTPFGPDLATVVAAIQAASAVLPITGAALTGFSPSSAEDADDDLGAVLRLIGALA